MLLMKRATRGSLNFGSLSLDLLSAVFFLMGHLLWAFCAVFGTSLLPLIDAGGIERSANNVVPYSRQILHPSAADHYYRVFLQIMSFTRNIRSDLDAVCQAHASHLAQRRIRLFRRSGVDASAHTALLRIAVECRRFALKQNSFAARPNQLIYRWQNCAPMVMLCFSKKIA